MVPWVGRQSATVTFPGVERICLLAIQVYIFEVKLCICYNKYLAIYVSVIVYTLTRVAFAEAM